MEEIWRPIEGTNGYYEVSNYGRVMSHCNYGGTTNRILKQKTDKDGYAVVHLRKEINKYKKVHRLVAEAFIPNPNGFCMINHKDENKGNNHAQNLEWCDAQYNNTYGHRLEKSLPQTWEKWSYTDNARKFMSYVGLSRNKRCASYKDDTVVMEYENITKAGESVSEKPITIAKCCVEGLKTKDGLSWKFI